MREVQQIYVVRRVNDVVPESGKGKIVWHYQFLFIEGLYNPRYNMSVRVTCHLIGRL